jgi:hypothetical protein
MMWEEESGAAKDRDASTVTDVSHDPHLLPAALFSLSGAACAESGACGRVL